MLVGQLRTRVLLWLLSAGGGLLIFYIVARVCIYNSNEFWYVWSIIGGTVIGLIIFAVLRNKNLVVGLTDTWSRVQQSSADKILELLPKMKTEIEVMLKNIDINKITSETLNNLNIREIELNHKYSDKNKGWTTNGRLLFFMS